MTEKLTHPLWQSILQSYALPGVKDICLKLQNEADMDVVLLLAERYWHSLGMALPSAHSLREYLVWRQQVTVPIRQVRMRLDKHQQPLRSQLLASELSAEQHAVSLLAALPESAFTEDAALLKQPYAYLQGSIQENAQNLWLSFADLVANHLVNPLN